jgi:hypothetical protein
MNYKELDEKIESEENEDLVLFMINQRHQLEPYPKYLFTEDLYAGLWQNINNFYYNNAGPIFKNPTKTINIQTGSGGMSNISNALNNIISGTTSTTTTSTTIKTGKGTNIGNSYFQEADKTLETIYIFKVKNFRFKFINDKFEKFEKY